MSNEQIRHALELGLESATDLLSDAPRSQVMQISARVDAIRAAINSLAAPSAASDAPGLPPLPQFNCTYSDHSYPSYNKHAMTEYGKACYAAAISASQAAPKEALTDQLNAALMRACGELPDGYNIRIECERGAGWVEWCDTECNWTVIDDEEDGLSSRVDKCVEAALAAAGVAPLPQAKEGV